MDKDVRSRVLQRPFTVFVPLLVELTAYSSRQARGDVLAGLAAAAVLIPQSMAYAQVAGLSPAVGLYAALGAAVGYALFTSTRVVSVGPSSVMAIMTFTAVQDRAHGAAGRAVALAAGLSLLAGLVCLAGAALRLGNLAELLSQPVMLGYLAGSGVVIIAGQAKHLVGVALDGRGAIVQVTQVLTHLDRAHPLTAILGLGCLVVLVLLARYAPKLPGSLVVLLGAVVVSVVARLADHGVALVGTVSRGLPIPALPALSAADVWALLPAAAGVALIASVEIGRAGSGLGAYRAAQIDADRELAALGAANVAAGVLGGIPSAASYSRSTSARGAGATTQVFQLVIAGAVVVALLAGSPLAAWLPLTALAAVAMTSAARLIDVPGFLVIWRGWRAEGVIALFAAIGVIGLGALRGLLLAIALAVWQLVRRAAHPHDAVLAYTGPDQPPREADGDTAHPDVLLYRVDAPLFFANAQRVRERLLTLARDRGPGLRWVILDAEAVFYLDSTAAAALALLAVDLRASGCRLGVARARSEILTTMRANPYAHGATRQLPAFPSVRDAFEATQRWK